ncbi:MAG TPA: hypothetical protein VFU02_25250 [Polyangiaceae bacterium]|nr:hypothetical protein [Polyangiaceae bacterium]
MSTGTQSGTGAGASDGAGTATTSAGALTTATGSLVEPMPGDSDEPCSLPADAAEAPVFAEQIFARSQLTTEQRVLYTWTTEEQIVELRAGAPLLSRTEREGLGPGAAYEYFAQASETNAVAALLNQARFAPSRHAWVHPWATRMGWPGESYGNQLIQIVLKPDAWLVKVVSGQFSVWDLSGQQLEEQQALDNPDRIGVVYFQKDSALDGSECGTFGSKGKQGFREYILNNPAMIESWSHGTTEILQRLQADIALVEAFAQRIRACPETRGWERWSGDVICGDFYRSADTELGAYEQALALTSEYYHPQPANMVALAETLEADLFVPDPLEGAAGAGSE